MNVAAIPRRVPLLIEYYKGARLARSLAFVVSAEGDVVMAAGTLDGRQPMGLVYIDANEIKRIVRLEEGEGVGG